MIDKTENKMPARFNQAPAPSHIRVATQRKSAFTLVELLVVIAIIGVLVGLLLPAVQAARESARLNSCKNNLKQFGLGMHNYESSFGKLPPGYEYEPGADGNQAGYSWGAWLLPFVEQSALHDRLDFDKPVFDLVNTAAREMHLDLFLCPTDTISPDGFIEMGPARFAMGCYVANFGPPDLDITQEKNEGPFYRNSKTELRHIADGLSNTLMIGERVNGPFAPGASHGNHFEFETTWAGAVRDIDDSTDDHGHMVLFQAGHTPNAAESDDRDISAPHNGLAQFLMCDGSVRAIQEEIDFDTYLALSTMAGGEVATDL